MFQPRLTFYYLIFCVIFISYKVETSLLKNSLTPQSFPSLCFVQFFAQILCTKWMLLVNPVYLGFFILYLGTAELGIRMDFKRMWQLESHPAFPGAGPVGRQWADRMHDMEDSLSSLCLAGHSDWRDRGQWQQVPAQHSRNISSVTVPHFQVPWYNWCEAVPGYKQ